MYFCVPSAPGAHRGQRRMWGPLGQVSVNHCVSAGDLPGPLPERALLTAEPVLQSSADFYIFKVFLPT